MDDRSGEVLAVAALFFVLAWLTVSLRVYVRGFMTKTWGKDDTCMVICLVCLLIVVQLQLPTDYGSFFSPYISSSRLWLLYTVLDVTDGISVTKMRELH